MIRGEKVELRTRRDSDVPFLQAELYEDVAMRSRVDSRPWRPLPPDAAESPAAAGVPSDDRAYFSVVELASRELAGEALLWGIDPHNRTAHLGISLLPGFRGRGLAGDAVRVLCAYGFTVRGMQRLQVETLADNTAMIAAATGAGFRVEGTLRRSAWVYGAFADIVILGLLAEEWTPLPGSG
ncbi:GNAT family N-acetyltransferase [Streptomyces sp. NPDC003483]